MQKVRSSSFAFLLLVLLLVSIACQAAAAPAATATASVTAVPPTFTATTPPTSTSSPTATPNIAATQEIEARQKLLQSYADAGYIPSTSGTFEDLADFNEAWAQLGYYQWWPIHDPAVEYGDIVFNGHFNWETAASTSDLSGCGVVFGLQPNGDHYAAFIDRSRILFQMARGGQAYMVGKTRGSGRLNLPAPGDADIALIVRGTTTYVVVNGAATQYTLSADQSSSGQFAFSLLSGTNKDFGTRCAITDAFLWTPTE